MKLDAIKDAIQHLSQDERRNLADWFAEMEEGGWDEEIKCDYAPGGRGEQLCNKLERKNRR